MTWKQALSKAAWRSLYLLNFFATYYTFRYVFQNLRQGKADPMAGLIGKEVLAIWALAELVILCFILAWVTRERSHE